MRRWRCGSRNPSQRWRTDERQWRGQFGSFGCFVTDRFQQFQKPIDFVCGSRPLLPIRHRQSSHIPSKVIAQQRRKITHTHKTIHLSGFHVDKKKKKNSHYCNIPELVQCHLFGWWPVFHVLWAFTHFISVKDIFIRVQYKQHIYI